MAVQPFSRIIYPNVIAELVLDTPRPAQIESANVRQIFDLKDSYLKTPNQRTLAKMVHHAVCELLKTVSGEWGRALGEERGAKLYSTVMSIEAQQRVQNFWNTMPSNSHLEVLQKNGNQLHIVKIGDSEWSEATIPEEGRTTFMPFNSLIYARPFSPTEEIHPLLNEHLLPPLTDIAFAYYQQPSVEEEHLKDLERRLERFTLRNQ